MIKIYYDFSCIQQVEIDEYTRLIKEISDYIYVRQFIRRALDDVDHNYTVYVQSRIVAKWLDDLRDYGSQVIHWEEINLRDRFHQQFDFLLPSELNEAAIQELNLLNLPAPDYAAINDPSGWILSQLIHPVWRYIKPSSGHLADLSAWAVDSSPIPLSLIPLIKARLAQWINIDNRYKIFLQCTGLDSWHNIGEAILLNWTLQYYPIDFPIRQELNGTPVENCSKYIDLCCILLTKYNSEFQHYWGLWLTNKPTVEEFIKSVKSMSGLTIHELNIVQEWAQKNSQHLTLPILDIVKQKFSYLPKCKNILIRLENLICPHLPQIPDESWCTEQWLNWATVEYMPYFAWVIRNRQERDKQIQLADSFSNWLINHYPQLIFNNEFVVTSQISRVQELISSKKADIVLWFIIDGLTWWQSKKLAAILVENGMGVAEIRPVLSALPSVTSISGDGSRICGQNNYN